MYCCNYTLHGMTLCLVFVLSSSFCGKYMHNFEPQCTTLNYCRVDSKAIINGKAEATKLIQVIATAPLTHPHCLCETMDDNCFEGPPLMCKSTTVVMNKKAKIK